MKNLSFTNFCFKHNSTRKWFQAKTEYFWRITTEFLKHFLILWNEVLHINRKRKTFRKQQILILTRKWKSEIVSLCRHVPDIEIFVFSWLLGHFYIEKCDSFILRSKHVTTWKNNQHIYSLNLFKWFQCRRAILNTLLDSCNIQEFLSKTFFDSIYHAKIWPGG